MLGSAFTDNNRKLEMRRILMVCSVDCPAIPGQVNPSAASIDHRLYADHHPIDKPAPMTPAPVIGNARLFVHLLAESVAFQLANDGESERFSIRLHRVSDIASTIACHSRFNSFVERSLRHIQKLAGLRINLPERECVGGVTVVPLV